MQEAEFWLRRVFALELFFVWSAWHFARGSSARQSYDRVWSLWIFRKSGKREL